MCTPNVLRFLHTHSGNQKVRSWTYLVKNSQVREFVNFMISSTSRTRFFKAWFTISTIFRLNFLWAKCFKKVLTDYTEKLLQTLGKHLKSNICHLHVLCRKNALEIIKKNTHVGVLHYHITSLNWDSTTDAFSTFFFFFGRGMAAISQNSSEQLHLRNVFI